MQNHHIVIDARIRRAGTGRYIDRLLDQLQKIDTQNSYTVLLEPSDPWQPSAPNYKGRPCKYRQFSFNPLEQIGFSWQLYRLRPDLVHFSMTQQPIFFLGRYNPWNMFTKLGFRGPSSQVRSRGCAIVTTTHDLTMLRFTRAGRLPGWLHSVRMAAYKFLFWFSHKKSNRIIVPSKFVAEDLIKHYPFTKNKIVITYEAAEGELAGNPEPLSGVKKPFILHVGSPFPHKNIKRLVEAFEILKEKQPDLQLILAGKKEFYFNELEAWINTLQVKDSILLPGRIEDAELKWLYQNAEAYVLPSLSEGFGLPGLEAMAHGCPLISSRVTCLPEVYGEAAEYFDPENVEDMTSAISKGLNDKALRSKLINLGSTQATKYSWGRMAEQTLEIYKKMLS